jgi:carbamoyltransferase
MIILGLNAFHGDSSAALVRDGALVAAAEEERFRRIKHWAGFPSAAIEYCLREAAIDLADIDHIAVNQDSRANILGKLGYLIRRRPNPAMIISRLKNRRARAGIPDFVVKHWPSNRFRGQFNYIEHHLAHLFSAFHVSPFDRAAVVSVDGFGDFSSAAWGLGDQRGITVAGRVYFPHSLGIFYQALTQYLGFPYYGDEYKVMGLAPYGKPVWLNALRDVVMLLPDGRFELNLKYFRHHRDEVAYQWTDGAPSVGCLYSSPLEDLLGPARDPDASLENRHRDIARSVQAIYEEAFFNLLNAVYQRTGSKNLALAGGCAMNSVANGKVRRTTQFRHLYVQAAAGDAGGAVGAAFAVWHKLSGQRSFVMDHAYWGPAFTGVEIESTIVSARNDLSASGCSIETVTDEAELCRRTAAVIADGKVVGWFQGRMEWGPRALGNRSILCDPRRADMKGILNRKIKRRESFRPFAPSILEEEVPAWFEDNDSVPFMMQVFQIREEKRAQIPAVTHVDGSGRLQTVSRRANPRYYRLIEAFRDLTGVPMVLNTSFNENEPVVCKPAQAIDCFLRTQMDCLVLGNTVLSRQNKNKS